MLSESAFLARRRIRQRASLRSGLIDNQGQRSSVLVTDSTGKLAGGSAVQRYARAWSGGGDGAWACGPERPGNPCYDARRCAPRTWWVLARRCRGGDDAGRAGAEWVGGKVAVTAAKNPSPRPLPCEGRGEWTPAPPHSHGRGGCGGEVCEGRPPMPRPELLSHPPTTRLPEQSRQGQRCPQGLSRQTRHRHLTESRRLYPHRTVAYGQDQRTAATGHPCQRQVLLQRHRHLKHSSRLVLPTIVSRSPKPPPTDM